MEQTVFVIDGYGGRADGGFIRVDDDSNTPASVIWFETPTEAKRFLDIRNATRNLPFRVVATTPRELRTVHWYEYWSKSNGDIVGPKYRIQSVCVDSLDSLNSQDNTNDLANSLVVNQLIEQEYRAGYASGYTRAVADLAGWCGDVLNGYRTVDEFMAFATQRCGEVGEMLE